MATQKPLKYENIQIITNKPTKSPTPGRAPKTHKKKSKMIIFGPFSYCVWYFFRIFGARPGVWDFVGFSYFYLIDGFLSPIYEDRGISHHLTKLPLNGRFMSGFQSENTNVVSNLPLVMSSHLGLAPCRVQVSISQLDCACRNASVCFV